MTDTKCVLARKQIMLSEQGRVAPCCNFSVNIPIADYEDIAEGYATRLDNGERIPECNLCWETESKGFTSVRQSANAIESIYEGDGITAMDIRIHNKCNLACNMCWPGFSTLWGKLKNHKDINNIIPQSSIDKAISLSTNLRKLSMQGGEPFYGNEYVDFVDSLPNKSQVSIDVFSNMITIDANVISRWSDELEDLKINASVDGIGNIYETIRWPTTWKKFERNAIKVYKILNSNMSFFYTVQAMNISCIKEFIQWRNDNCQNSKIVFSNVIHDDEITYKGITTEERDGFLQDKDLILSMVNYDPERELWYNREYNDLCSLFQLVENLDISEENVSKRRAFDRHTQELRNRYSAK